MNKLIPNTVLNPPKRTREFYTVEDFRDRTFLDALADAFTPPDQLTLHQTDYGFMAHIRDGQRIREYFRVAVAAEKKGQNQVTSTSGQDTWKKVSGG